MSYNPDWDLTAHWHIQQPPIWGETMKATHVDPDEPMEMWLAYGNLAFLKIDVNSRGG